MKAIKTLHIGAHHFKLEMVSESSLSNDEQGDMCPDKNTIHVSKALCPSRQVEVIFHECVHAMLVGHDIDKEELVALLLGEGLALFIRENPVLIKRAMKTLSDEKKSFEKN